MVEVSIYFHETGFVYETYFALLPVEVDATVSQRKFQMRPMENAILYARGFESQRAILYASGFGAKKQHPYCTQAIGFSYVATAYSKQINML